MLTWLENGAACRLKGEGAHTVALIRGGSEGRHDRQARQFLKRGADAQEPFSDEQMVAIPRESDLTAVAKAARSHKASGRRILVETP